MLLGDIRRKVLWGKKTSEGCFFYHIHSLKLSKTTKNRPGDFVGNIIFQPVIFKSELLDSGRVCIVDWYVNPSLPNTLLSRWWVSQTPPFSRPLGGPNLSKPRVFREFWKTRAYALRIGMLTCHHVLTLWKKSTSVSLTWQGATNHYLSQKYSENKTPK